MLLVLAACDRPAPPPAPLGGATDAPAGPIAELAGALGIDAASLEPMADPPAPAGNLEGDIESFTTVDACVRAHPIADPLLGDALEAVGYDTFLRDACRVLAAAKARDASPCASIDASALRRRCEATVAEVAGRPDGCPWDVPTKPELGRDPECVAIATPDARLCAAVRDRAGRAACEGIATHDDA